MLKWNLTLVLSKGKIKNLLGPRDVTNSTKLILVNAIYFNAEWEVKFKAEDTELKPFRLSKVSSSSSYCEQPGHNSCCWNLSIS